MKKNLGFAQMLLISSVLGALVGYFAGESILVIKPAGDLFTRLLFMLVPGLVFFFHSIFLC